MSIKKSILLITLLLVVSLKSKSQDTLWVDVTFAGKTSGKISKEEVIKFDKLVLENKNDKTLRISHFLMTVVCKDKDISEYENKKDDYLTQEMMEAIRNCSIGCNILFEFIRITSAKTESNHFMGRPLMLRIE